MDKGTDKQYVAEFFIHSTSDVGTKFQNSRSSSSGGQKIPYALPWSERLKKGNNRKRRQN